MRFLLLALLTIPAPAAILPGVIGTWKQTAVTPLEVKTDRPLWDEYGLQAAEQAAYDNAGRGISVQAWRLSDSSGALGAFHYLRPAAAKPAPKLFDLSANSVLTPEGALLAFGNYVVRFAGAVPEQDALANLFRSMPRLEHASLPSFMAYLPDARQLPNSQHYVEGPVALRQFFPGVQPSAAGFHLGAEAAVADYQPGLKMALFSYPTPAIARDREAEISKTPGTVVKRSGPLVAVVLHPKDQNSAEALLSKVRWEAAVTTGEKPVTKKDNPGNLMVNIFYLILILTGFCVLSGVAFGFIRTVFRRGGASGDGEEILALHLGGR